MRKLPFERALVTGASSGIGEEITRQLVAAGVPVVAVARRRDRLEALANELPGVEVLVADLLTSAGVEAVSTRIQDTNSPIDLVVNNAGFGSQTILSSHDSQRIADEVTLNVTALTLLSRAAVVAMAPRKRGYIINVASIAAFNPSPYMAVYAATKAFVLSLSQGLHEEVKSLGIHVTALCPGLTATEFQQVAGTQNHHDMFPKQVWTSPQLVARVGIDDVVKNRAVSVPGALYKVLGAVSSVMPRPIARRVFGMGMRARIPKK